MFHDEKTMMDQIRQYRMLMPAHRTADGGYAKASAPIPLGAYERLQQTKLKPGDTVQVPGDVRRYAQSDGFLDVRHPRTVTIRQVYRHGVQVEEENEFIPFSKLWIMDRANGTLIEGAGRFYGD
jgi:hypothetical protein